MGPLAFYCFLLDIDGFLFFFIFSMKWNSPQAIFNDPFRRGNNILVSSVLILQYFVIYTQILWTEMYCWLQTSIWCNRLFNSDDWVRSSAILTLQLVSQFPQTRDALLQRYLAILMLSLKKPGISYLLPCYSSSFLFG